MEFYYTRVQKWTWILVKCDPAYTEYTFGTLRKLQQNERPWVKVHNFSGHMPEYNFRSGSSLIFTSKLFLDLFLDQPATTNRTTVQFTTSKKLVFIFSTVFTRFFKVFSCSQFVQKKINWSILCCRSASDGQNLTVCLGCDNVT